MAKYSHPLGTSERGKKTGDLSAVYSNHLGHRVFRVTTQARVRVTTVDCKESHPTERSLNLHPCCWPLTLLYGRSLTTSKLPSFWSSPASLWGVVHHGLVAGSRASHPTIWDLLACTSRKACAICRTHKGFVFNILVSKMKPNGSIEEKQSDGMYSW